MQKKQAATRENGKNNIKADWLFTPLTHTQYLNVCVEGQTFVVVDKIVNRLILLIYFVVWGGGGGGKSYPL